MPHEPDVDVRVARVHVHTTSEVLRVGITTLLARHDRRLAVADSPLVADVEILDAILVCFDAQAPTARAPRIGLVSGDTADSARALRLQLDRVLPVTVPGAELVATVRELVREGRGDHPPQAMLSPREAQVLDLICAGSTNVEIAVELRVSINSVKTYIRSAYAKIGVARRSQAVLWGLAHGLGPSGATRPRP